MITSDTQLESPKPVPQGEAPKDDLAVNSHPADGVGAPVLDGEVLHTERPNVNAMREAIEAQSEMEVGKPVAETQAEVKAEATGKEVTVEKGSGTQIIINIAGKSKTMAFSNKATATAFIKGASVKFGKKFKLIASEVITLHPGDRISWKLHQLSNESRHGTVTGVLPENDEGLLIFDAKLESISGADKGMSVWGYMGLIYDINGNHVKPVNPEAAEFEVLQTKTGEWTGKYQFEGKVDSTTHHPEIVKGNWVDTPQHRGFSNYPGIYVLLPGSNSAYGNTEGGFQSDRQAETYNREFLGGKGKVHVQVDKQATMAPQQDAENDKPATSGISDIGAGAPSFKSANSEGTDKKYAIYTGPTIVKQMARRFAEAGWLVSNIGTERVYVITDKGVDAILAFLGPTWKNRDIQELPRRKEDDAANRLTMEKDMPKEAAFNFSPSAVPSQVVQEFYPELQHELISYPNVTNAPMQNPEISGDTHELGTGAAEGIGEATLVMNQEELLPGAIEDAFEGMTRIGYISTSPAGGAGIGRDGKPQVLEGLPLRKENDIRGPMFMEEFNAQYDTIPGNALTMSASAVISKKVAAAEEKKQFSLFLKKVMGEVAASFIAAFKVTSKMPMNKVPGVGEIQLAQVEQATNTSAFNIVNTGSRVKYLMEKLTDSEIQDAINDAYAQGAVWHEAKEGGFVYEVFVRAETIDTESMLLKYKFVTGTRENTE